jgi:RNA 3'-terminal phosphate cyclase
MLDVPTESPALIQEAGYKGVQVVRDLEDQLTHGGVVDMYLADQIVIFMALATSGYTQSKNCPHPTKHRRCEILVGKVSLHTITAMRVIERLLTDIAFSLEDKEGLGMVIICEIKGNPSRGRLENSSAAR